MAINGLNKNKYINLTSNGIPLGAKSIRKCNYNPNLVWINVIQKIFPCSYLYYMSVYICK